MWAVEEVQESDRLAAAGARTGGVRSAIAGADTCRVVEIARQRVASVGDAHLTGIGEGLRARNEGADGLTEVALVLAMASGCAGEDPTSDRQALGLIGLEQGIGCPPERVSEFPAQVKRILHTCVQTLSASGRMDVRRVASDE